MLADTRMKQESEFSWGIGAEHSRNKKKCENSGVGLSLDLLMDRT